MLCQEITCSKHFLHSALPGCVSGSFKTAEEKPRRFQKQVFSEEHAVYSPLQVGVKAICSYTHRKGRFLGEKKKLFGIL